MTIKQLEMWPLVRMHNGRYPLRPFKDNRLRATAYHEAGHAVLAWHLGLKIRNLSIHKYERSLGRMRSSGVRRRALSGDTTVAMLFHAGGQAEMVAALLGLLHPYDSKKTMVGCGSDLNHLANLYHNHHLRNPDATRDVVGTHYWESLRLLLLNYSALVRLAELLLDVKKIAGSRAIQVIEEAVSELHQCRAWESQSLEIEEWVSWAQSMSSDKVQQQPLMFPLFLTRDPARFLTTSAGSWWTPRSSDRQ